MESKTLVVAICTYNRAHSLPALVQKLRAQECPLSFEILFVDNNSSDETPRVLVELSMLPGAALRYVKESHQGIPFARNRALEESARYDYMLFIDDDELPREGILTAAVHAFEEEGAECVGGRVHVNFERGQRPHWLNDELLGFLAEIDYGSASFWIDDESTPLWTANIGYRMEIFSRVPALRFDCRYNRKGHGVGGGSDAMMFREMVKQGLRIRYRPDMIVEHHVDTWRLKRGYFLRLHYAGGRKFGEFESGNYSRTILGVPPFFLTQTVRHLYKTLIMWIQRRPGLLRQAMNVAYSLGVIHGRIRRRCSCKQ